MSDKLTESRRENRLLWKKFGDLKKEKEVLEYSHLNMCESLEIMTYDKEKAEERAKNLQQKINTLQKTAEAIELEDIKREEGELVSLRTRILASAFPSNVFPYVAFATHPSFQTF